MARIALQHYFGEAERLLDANKLADAAARCHFLLQQYPRYVAAYRLFGRALLEQQVYQDSIDVFERVLSADPEDLIAHAGLSEAFRELGDLPRAIWHMERAFEVEPYNQAIQHELKQLYARKEELITGPIQLTGAALARLYFRGGLFGLAVAELRAVLADFPDRVDLQVLLAESLYWDNQRVAASALCLDLLEHLPDCIKASAILAEVWLSADRANEAHTYVERLFALTLLDTTRCDDKTVVGRALLNSKTIRSVPVMVDEPGDLIAGPADPAFTQEFTGDETLPSKATDTPAKSDEVPEWLRDIDEPEADSTVSAEPVTMDEDDRDVLDWLQEVAAAEGDWLAISGDEGAEDSREEFRIPAEDAVGEEDGPIAGDSDTALIDEEEQTSDDHKTLIAAALGAGLAQRRLHKARREDVPAELPAPGDDVPATAEKTETDQVKSELDIDRLDDISEELPISGEDTLFAAVALGAGSAESRRQDESRDEALEEMPDPSDDTTLTIIETEADQVEGALDFDWLYDVADELPSSDKDNLLADAALSSGLAQLDRDAEQLEETSNRTAIGEDVPLSPEVLVTELEDREVDTDFSDESFEELPGNSEKSPTIDETSNAEPAVSVAVTDRLDGLPWILPVPSEDAPTAITEEQGTDLVESDPVDPIPDDLPVPLSLVDDDLVEPSDEPIVDLEEPKPEAEWSSELTQSLPELVDDFALPTEEPSTGISNQDFKDDGGDSEHDIPAADESNARTATQAFDGGDGDSEHGIPAADELNRDVTGQTPDIDWFSVLSEESQVSWRDIDLPAEEGTVDMGESEPGIDWKGELSEESPVAADEQLETLGKSKGDLAEFEFDSNWLDELPKELSDLDDRPAASDILNFGLLFPDPDLDGMDDVIEEFSDADKLPDWLYDAVGFTGELAEPDGYEVPDWLKERTDFPSEISDVDQGPDPARPSLEATEHDKADDDYLEVGDRLSTDTDLADGGFSESSLSPPAREIPGWLKDEDEPLEELPKDILVGKESDDYEILSEPDETVAWLEELAIEFGSDSEEENKTQFDRQEEAGKNDTGDLNSDEKKDGGTADWLRDDDLG